MGKIKKLLDSKIVKEDVGEETVLTWRETLSYALGRGAQGMSTSTMSSSTVNYFLTNLMAINPLTIASVRLWAGLWDAFNDPIMGILVDKTHTKDGKMRPYIKIAPFFCALFTALLFFDSAKFPYALRLIFAIIALVGWDMTYTAFDIPMGALAFSITKSGVERTKLFGWGSIVRAIIGSIPGVVVPAALLFPYFESHTQGAYIVAGIIAFVGIIGFTRPTYKNCQERAEHNEEEPTVKECFKLLLKNRPLFMLFLSNMAFLLVTAKTAADMYFAIDLVGSAKFYTVLEVALAPAPFVAGLVVPVMVQKLGKKADFKKIFIVCCLGAAALHLLIFVICRKPFIYKADGTTPPMFFMIMCILLLFLSSIPLEFKNLLQKEMEAETVDYVEWKTGERAEGTMLSLMSFTGKLTNSVSSTIALAILGWAAYRTHTDAIATAQTVTAKYALLSLETLVPMAGYLLMLVPIIFYNITRADHDKMMKEIAERKLKANKED